MCLVWGTTYLGIRMGLEMFPPLVLIGIRYTSGGAVLLALARARGMVMPRGRELFTACWTSMLTLGIGNGALVFAELWIPSGTASLILTMTPFWMVGVEALLPGGEPLHAPTLGGMAVGLAGAALLFTPGGGTRPVSLLGGFLLLQFCMAGWSFGSLLQRRRPGKAHSVVVAGVQMLVNGLTAGACALVIPEHPIRWETRSVVAIVYLIVFGSILGYAAYVYMLDRLSVALASVYTYVNVVVAMALGWLVYREPFGWRETAAMLVLFAGVGAVKRYSAKARPEKASAGAAD